MARLLALCLVITVAISGHINARYTDSRHGKAEAPHVVIDEDLFLGGALEEAHVVTEDLYASTTSLRGVVDHDYLVDGDIRLTKEQYNILQGMSSLPRPRKGVPVPGFFIWPEGPGDGCPRVPFLLNDPSLNRTLILEAVAHWEEHTCIRFQEMNNETSQEQPHLRFMRLKGCWSYYGMLENYGQPISIGNNCDKVGIIIHEIGHAIGFFHEHSRSDRDEFITVNWDNVKEGEEHNFDKKQDNNFNITYDYYSIMHYGSRSFTSNSKTTMSTLNPLVQGIIGQRNGLSFRDMKMANLLYNCTGKWLDSCSLENNPCQNEGYIGSKCSCVCPHGTHGRYCQDHSGDYYDGRQYVGKNVTQSGIITSPGYPELTAYPTRDSTWIMAPECYNVQLQFTDVKFYQFYPSEGKCFDGIEIRTSNMAEGEWFCEGNIRNGSSFTSAGREIIIYMEAKISVPWSKYQAEVKFVPDPHCKSTPQPVTTTTNASILPPCIFSCPDEMGRYAHPRDCKEWVDCDHWQPYVKYCPGNLYFNPELHVCDWSEHAGCTAYPDNDCELTTVNTVMPKD